MASSCPRWSQMGFGRTSSTTRAQVTPRNLHGVQGRDEQPARGRRRRDGDERLGRRRGARVDARRQLHGDAPDPDADRGVGPREPRRPAADDRRGRRRAGRRSGGHAEFDAVPLGGAWSRRRSRSIPPTRTSAWPPRQRTRAPSLLRRGYSFTDGIDPVTGQLDAGLFFICFQRDPRTQFVPLQRRLASSDALNEYIKHVGSGIFAVPPGAHPGGYVGQDLFA